MRARAIGKAGEWFQTRGIGAIPPFAVVDRWAPTCGLALGDSWGADWKGRLLLGEKGRLLALSTTSTKSPTRTLAGRLTVLEGVPAKFLPVGLAEEKGGEGVWVLAAARDFRSDGQLPLEEVVPGKLLLVQNKEAIEKREAICGPLGAQPTVREELDQVPSGVARDSKARELVWAETSRVEQFANLCLDTSVEGKIRQAAWKGLANSGQAEKYIARVLATDNTGIKSSACRFCYFLTKLPEDAFGPLLDCVQDPDDTVVREAACAAGLHRLPGAAESLGAILFQRDEGDPQTQSGTLFGLGKLGKDGAEKMLSAAQTGVRAEAVRALKARVGYPWPASLGGKAEVWLDHPHLGPEHLALYFDGLLAWHAWLQSESSGLQGKDPVEKGMSEALAWLESHPEQQGEVLEAGLKLSGLLPLDRAPVEWWRLMVKEQKGNVCALALGNMARLKLPAWAGEVLTELEREDLSSEERLNGIHLMRNWGQMASAIRLAVPLLEPGVIPGQDPVVTREALDCLEESDPVRGREAAFRVIQSAKPISQPMAKAALILARDPESRASINSSFIDGKNLKYPFLAWEVWLDALSQAGAGEDLDRAVQSYWLGNDSARERLRKNVESRGSARRGLFVFLNRGRAGCVQCHSLGGSGGGVGPQLTPGVSSELILEAMVRPGNKVHPDFPLVTVPGPDGQQVRGVLSRPLSKAGNTWVIFTPGGRMVSVPKTGSAPPQGIPGSLMPSVGDKQLTYQEILDLLALLGSPRGKEEMAALGGLVVEAVLFEGKSATAKQALSNSLGLLEVTGEKPKIGFFVRSDQAGSATLKVFATSLAPHQVNPKPLSKAGEMQFFEMEMPPGGGKNKIALRLSGPQGMVTGAFPR